MSGSHVYREYLRSLSVYRNPRSWPICMEYVSKLLKSVREEGKWVALSLQRDAPAYRGSNFKLRCRATFHRNDSESGYGPNRPPTNVKHYLKRSFVKIVYFFHRMHTCTWFQKRICDRLCYSRIEPKSEANSKIDPLDQQYINLLTKCPILRHDRLCVLCERPQWDKLDSSDLADRLELVMKSWANVITRFGSVRCPEAWEVTESSVAFHTPGPKPYLGTIQIPAILGWLSQHGIHEGTWIGKKFNV